MQGNKILKVSQELHEQIVKHCDLKGYKIYKWVEKVLLEELNKENKFAQRKS